MFLSVIVDMLDVLDDIGSVSGTKWFMGPRVIDKNVLFVEKRCDFAERGDSGATN